MKVLTDLQKKMHNNILRWGSAFEGMTVYYDMALIIHSVKLLIIAKSNKYF